MTDKKEPTNKGSKTFPKYEPIPTDQIAKNVSEGQKRANAHPGGSNLILYSDRPISQEARDKSQATKAKRRAEIKELGLFVKALDTIGYEVSGQAPKALDVLKLLMVKAMQNGDDLETARLAALVAEYEAPKITRKEIIQKNVDAKDLTDEELTAALAQLDVVSNIGVT